MIDGVTVGDLAAVPDSRVQPARETFTVRLEPATLAWLRWRAAQGGVGPSVAARQALELAAQQDRDWQALRRQAQQQKRRRR